MTLPRMFRVLAASLFAALLAAAFLPSTTATAAGLSKGVWVQFHPAAVGGSPADPWDGKTAAGLVVNVDQDEMFTTIVYSDPDPAHDNADSGAATLVTLDDVPNGFLKLVMILADYYQLDLEEAAGVASAGLEHSDWYLSCDELHGRKEYGL